MKKIVICLLAGLMTLALNAEDLTWLTSFPDAQAQAKKENKLLFIDVTGSDWCLYCKEMDLDVFKKKPFIDYAKTNLVLMLVDFPLAVKQTPELQAANTALTNKFAVIGLPTYLVLNPDGKLVWKQEGYLDGGPKEMISQLNKARKKK
jgi:thioredoxin-related protein